MTKFSIIMAVYNNEKYFPLAVESIEKQDYDNYELIIVEDGSTDRTPQIADALAAKNPHIKVIHQENQWIYSSFNNGIAAAAGEYIYILNSDDALMPGTLQLFDRKVKEYHPDIIWTKVMVRLRDAEQDTIIFDGHHKEDLFEDERFYANKAEVEKAWPYFWSSDLARNQANLYRREIMQSRLFRNDTSAGDTLYNISIADQIQSALVLPEPVYVFYIYKTDKVNESYKYYPNAHSVNNEIFDQYKYLFQSWHLDPNTYMEMLCKGRMSELTREMRMLQAVSCPLTIEEKIQFMLLDCTDETVKKYASESNREEELESRILSGMRELFIKEPIEPDSEMYFVYELMESLLCYEKDEEDYWKIEKAVNHPLNPNHIGNIFYQKLLQGR